MNPVLFFDTLIILGLGGSIFGSLYFFRHYSCATKSQLPCWWLSLLFAIPALVLVWGSFIEPQLLAVRSYEYAFVHEPLPTEKRIVFLTDIHVGPYKKTSFSQKVVNTIRAIDPDAVLIGGDYFFWHHPDVAKHYLAPYATLVEDYPVIGVMGNHAYDVGWPGIDNPDYELAQATRDAIHELGILLLEDATTTLFDPAHEITVIGAQDIYSEVDNYQGIDKPAFKEKRIILLAHNPDIVLEAKNEIDLVLSGHTHGGQIRLPFIGPLAKPGPTPLPREYFQGPSQWGETTLYVSSGLGESGVRARLFNPPEIVVITLR